MDDIRKAGLSLRYDGITEKTSTVNNDGVRFPSLKISSQEKIGSNLGCERRL